MHKKQNIPKQKVNTKDKNIVKFNIMELVEAVAIYTGVTHKIQKEKRRLNSKQQYMIIKLQGRIEAYRDLLMYRFKFSPSYLQDLDTEVRQYPQYQEKVDKLVNQIAPEGNTLITNNLNAKMQNIISTKQFNKEYSEGKK